MKQNKQWFYKGKLLPEQRPSSYGFIYKIEYTDGTYYYGKKSFWSQKEIDAKQNGVERNGHVKFVNRNRDKKRVQREVIITESSWRTYSGSTKNSKGKVIAHKEILCFGVSKVHLTYLETKTLMLNNVLQDDNCLNANIGGKFYDNIFNPVGDYLMVASIPE